MTPTALVSLAVVHFAPAWIDVPRLVGEWRGESQFGRCTMVFWPNGACVEKSAGRLRASTYRVDPRKRPAEIDIWDRGAKGPRRGIYKISGDNLTMCWAEYLEDARPVGFKASSLRTEVLHLTRVARSASPAMEKALTELTPWANNLFIGNEGARLPVFVHYAGVIPKGETKTIRVKMTNIYEVPLELRPSTSEFVPPPVVRWPDRLDPKKTGYVEVEIGPRELNGEYAVLVSVNFRSVDPKTGSPSEDPKSDRPFKSWAELVIRFESR